MSVSLTSPKTCLSRSTMSLYCFRSSRAITSLILSTSIRSFSSISLARRAYLASNSLRALASAMPRWIYYMACFLSFWMLSHLVRRYWSLTFWNRSMPYCFRAMRFLTWDCSCLTIAFSISCNWSIYSRNWSDLRFDRAWRSLTLKDNLRLRSLYPSGIKRLLARLPF